MTIAIVNHSFHGDVLWSVPAARELARRAGEQADFFLAARGAQTRDLLLAQSFVRKVHVDGGGEEEQYSACHVLNTQGLENETLLDHYCRIAGLPRQGHWFELPLNTPGEIVPRGPFVVLAAKIGDGSEWMKAINGILREFAWLCPVSIVEVGVPGMTLTTDLGAIDRTSYGFLKMAEIISLCKVFVGTISAPLVLADAFPNVHRIAVHDGDKWNMNAVTKSGMNHYPVYPTGQQLADLVRSLL
jgi:hypothetical protein